MNRLFLVLTALTLATACDEKPSQERAEKSDAGVQFERIAPTPGDVKKANQNLKRIKNDVQKASDKRGERIEESARPE